MLPYQPAGLAGWCIGSLPWDVLFACCVGRAGYVRSRVWCVLPYYEWRYAAVAVVCHGVIVCTVRLCACGVVPWPGLWSPARRPAQGSVPNAGSSRGAARGPARWERGRGRGRVGHPWQAAPARPAPRPWGLQAQPALRGGRGGVAWDRGWDPCPAARLGLPSHRQPPAKVSAVPNCPPPPHAHMPSNDAPPPPPPSRFVRPRITLPPPHPPTHPPTYVSHHSHS